MPSSSAITQGSHPASSEGSIALTWRWQEQGYSGGISKWGICKELCLRVLEYAITRARFVPAFARYEKWQQALDHLGVLYTASTHGAMGVLLSLWMGFKGRFTVLPTYPR